MNDKDCIFCKIAQGSIPATKVFESDEVIGFKDLHPLAAKHFLFIHKSHSKNVVEMVESDPDQVKAIYQAIGEFSKKEGLADSGLRVVTNLGKHGGQTVFHTHFHVLGGEQLGGFGR